MPFFAAPRVLNRPHSITADVEIPEAGAEGVLLAQGTAAGGFTFFVKDGQLRYTHNCVARELLRRRVRRPSCPPGGTSSASSSSRPASPTCRTARARPGRLQLYGSKVGEARIDATVPMAFSADETTDVGSDTGTPVTDDFGTVGTPFNGRIRWVEIDIDEDAEDLDHLITPEERLQVAMARQ